MKKYDFLPSRHPPFLQDFCKKAQWRAKKLRERGSNTARPTEKGGGVSRLGRDSVDFGAISSRFRRDLQTSSCRFGRIGRDSVDFGASIRSISARFRRDFVAICRLPLVDSRRHHADTQAKTQKKARFLNRGIGHQLSQGVALLTFD